MPGKGRSAGGYFTDAQHQSVNAKHTRAPGGGKTNAAFDSQVKTRSTSWPLTNDRKVNEATVDVNPPRRRNKATV